MNTSVLSFILFISSTKLIHAKYIKSNNETFSCSSNEDCKSSENCIIEANNSYCSKITENPKNGTDNILCFTKTGELNEIVVICGHEELISETAIITLCIIVPIGIIALVIISNM